MVKRGIRLIAFYMILLMFVSPFVFAEEVSLKEGGVSLDSSPNEEIVELVEEDVSVNEIIEDGDFSGGEIVMMGERDGAMPLLVYLQRAVIPQDKLVLFGDFAVSLSKDSFSLSCFKATGPTVNSILSMPS